MKRLIAAIAGCVVLPAALWAVSGVAQEAKPSDAPRPSPGTISALMGMFNRGAIDPGLMILGSDQVQKELEVTDDQKSKLKALGEELRTELQKEFAGLAEGSELERGLKLLQFQEKLKARLDDARKQVDGILLPHQLERLQQLSFQVRGPSALTDPKLLAQLEITDSQKEQLLKLKEKIEAGRRAIFEGTNTSSLSPEQRRARGQEVREKMETLNKETTDAAMAILTAKQRETLERLQGKKFEFKWPGRPSGAPPAQTPSTEKK